MGWRRANLETWNQWGESSCQHSDESKVGEEGANLIVKLGGSGIGLVLDPRERGSCSRDRVARVVLCGEEREPGEGTQFGPFQV